MTPYFIYRRQKLLCTVSKWMETKSRNYFLMALKGKTRGLYKKLKMRRKTILRREDSRYRLKKKKMKTFRRRKRSRFCLAGLRWVLPSPIGSWAGATERILSFTFI